MESRSISVMSFSRLRDQGLGCSRIDFRRSAYANGFLSLGTEQRRGNILLNCALSSDRITPCGFVSHIRATGFSSVTVRQRMLELKSSSVRAAEQYSLDARRENDRQRKAPFSVVTADVNAERQDSHEHFSPRVEASLHVD